VTYLAEIAEEDAEGAVAELYEDIRRVLGLPLVNLVYRHLAAVGRLEEVWRVLPRMVAAGSVLRRALG
jgi:diketogulonate reductase-like aldo/keto reductase